MSTPPPSAPERRRSPWTARRIVLGAVLVYLVLVVVANRGSVSVNFIFFTTQASLFVVLILAIALGFLAGWLFDDVRARRRARG